MVVHSYVVWVGAILKYLKNYPFNFLIYAILLIAGYWSMWQGFVMMENTKVDCKKDSTPMKVKWAEIIPCLPTFATLNLFFEAWLKFKNKKLPKCKTSNFNSSFNHCSILVVFPSCIMGKARLKASNVH